ncbi:MAG: DNA/RNA nuclease SfsA [Spirochaetales bacterium]|nr:DNA/RNA nuclease SfsA [Spirochaetales bacterium]MCF7937089.1 DNA/RNA nuclease SfsA [Spirochaetales bacterium]
MIQPDGSYRHFSPDHIGLFLGRPNRFTVLADINGEAVRAHCPNPGRMEELLLPGARLIFEKAGKTASPQGRKTDFTLVGIFYRKGVLPLHSSRANQLVSDLVLPRLFPWMYNLRSEVRFGRSRFDFAFTAEGPAGKDAVLLEVKSCTLIEEGTAMFPDAPTERGKRHLEELAALAGSRWEGKLIKPMVLFLVASGRAERFLPNPHTDPAFSRALLQFSDTIDIRAVSVETDASGLMRIAEPELPVNLDPIRELPDGGAYLLLVRIETRKVIRIGSLGPLEFPRGWYVYAGSARRGLTARVARHKRQRKRMHWHIDYLLQEGSLVKSFPIRSRFDLECSLASHVRAAADGEVTNFGSSDCSCSSHLLFFDSDPRNNRRFVDTLLLFRHRFAFDFPVSPPVVN